LQRCKPFSFLRILFLVQKFVQLGKMEVEKWKAFVIAVNTNDKHVLVRTMTGQQSHQR